VGEGLKDNRGTEVTEVGESPGAVACTAGSEDAGAGHRVAGAAEDWEFRTGVGRSLNGSAADRADGGEAVAGGISVSDFRGVDRAAEFHIEFVPSAIGIIVAVNEESGEAAAGDGIGVLLSIGAPCEGIGLPAAGVADMLFPR